MMDDHASFGYWVRRRRKALDLTQDALAQQVACSVMTIRKIEGDLRRPSRQIAERLAECLTIPADQRAAFIKAARAELAVDRLPAPAAELTVHAPRAGPVATSDDDDSIVVAELAHPVARALPAGTVTFLFADLPAIPGLWQRDHSVAEAVLARYHTNLRQAVETYDGIVFKSVGDLVCAAFARVPHAVEAALASQRTLQSEPWHGVGPLQARAAIHTGSVELHDGEYVGLPLSRIARLLEVGHAGQTLVSLATYELVRDSLPPGAAIDDLGSHRLRDLTRPEQIYQLGAPDLPADFPPLRTLDQHQTNLPLQPTALIGREHEVAQVCALLRGNDARLLTLTGPGGTGKTRLALQVAAEFLDSFADGVYFVALAPIRDPALVIETIAATLGVKEGGDQPLPTLLKRHVRDKQLLLVLDNFEQVNDAAPLVAELLETAPRLKALVTSRACLQIYGECEFPVPPLALPDPRRLPPLERLTQYEAVRLFMERARAVKPDFAISDENAPAVAEICVRLDGLPLAIELAAVRIKVLTPQALLARLTRRLHVLTGGARNLPARQQTLRDAIAWSHELLPEAEQALFARLAVFVGGCTLEALEAVSNVDADVAADPLDTIQALVNNSLVRQEVRGNAEPRLHMLETIREYALEQLVVRGEEAALRTRHASYYLNLAQAAQPRLDTDQQEAWLDRLEAEHDNLRAALTWALERGETELAVRLSTALWRFWEMRGYFTEGRRWLSTVLDQIDEMDAALQAAAYTGAGTMAYHQREHAQAIQWHQHALDLYRSLDDKHGIAFALNNLGVQWLEQGDFAPAMQHLTESLALTQQLGQTRTSAYTRHNMAEMARWQADYVQAAELYAESLAVFRTLGDHWAACYSLVGLGKVVGYQGDDAQATRFCLEAMSLCQEQDHRELLTECLEGLAHSAARHGQGARAARLFGAAEQLRVVIDAPRAVVENQWYAEAVALVRAALDPLTYERAWLEGRRMPIEEAIAYAMSSAES
jgi:predicted ATPase/class 3 adenylate cyclase/DNA-binding XRE family transcriptional regulator